jgi:hypothetical protein
MPVAGITTPIEFATSEWDKLARAWRNLNPTDRDKEIARHLDKLRDQGKLRIYPELPGWDDVLRAGREPSGLTEAELRARRKRITTRIQQSVTPKDQQAVANVINAIDDVQDLTSFTGLVARLVLRAAPRVAARFVPVLGWIATASDVLNLLSFLTLAGGAALGIHTHGALGGVAASAGPAFARAALKREMWTALRRGRFKQIRAHAAGHVLRDLFDPRRKLAALTSGRGAGLLGKRVGLTEIIEGAQAVETLTGYGLSLGAIMGYLSDFSWALYRDVVAIPAGRIAPLLGAITKTAPEEFLILDDQDIPKIVPFDLPFGYGPTYQEFVKRHQNNETNGVPWAYYGRTKDQKPPYCYYASWIQHPDFPRVPHSVVYYWAGDYSPNSTTMNYARQRFSEIDLILTARPTVGYT